MANQKIRTFIERNPVSIKKYEGKKNQEKVLREGGNNKRTGEK